MYLTHDDLDLVVSIGCHRLQMVRGYIYSSVLIRQKDRTHSRCDTTDDSNLSTESSVTVSVFYKNFDIGRIPILNMKLITVLRSKFLWYFSEILFLTDDPKESSPDPGV